MHILIKPFPKQSIAYWLFCNTHAENRHQEITGTSINIDMINMTVDIVVYMSIENIRAVATKGTDL